jgi:hypothetical protein
VRERGVEVRAQLLAEGRLPRALGADDGDAAGEGVAAQRGDVVPVSPRVGAHGGAAEGHLASVDEQEVEARELSEALRAG